MVCWSRWQRRWCRFSRLLYIGIVVAIFARAWRIHCNCGIVIARTLYHRDGWRKTAALASSAVGLVMTRHLPKLTASDVESRTRIDGNIQVPMPLNFMYRRVRSGAAVSKIQDRIAGSSARRSPGRRQSNEARCLLRLCGHPHLYTQRFTRRHLMLCGKSPAPPSWERVNNQILT